MMHWARHLIWNNTSSRCRHNSSYYRHITCPFHIRPACAELKLKIFIVIRIVSGKFYAVHWFCIMHCSYPSLKRKGPENYEIWGPHKSAFITRCSVLSHTCPGSGEASFLWVDQEGMIALTMEEASYYERKIGKPIHTASCPRRLRRYSSSSWNS
jgi:hypothetical protein